MTELPDFFSSAGWTVSPINSLVFVAGCMESGSVDGTATKDVSIDSGFNRFRVGSLKLELDYKDVTDFVEGYSSGTSSTKYKFEFASGAWIQLTPVIKRRFFLKKKYSTEVVFYDGTSEDTHQVSISTSDIKSTGNVITISVTSGSLNVSVNNSSDSFSVTASLFDDLIKVTAINDPADLDITACALSYEYTEFFAVDDVQWPLDEVIAEICARAGLPENTINLSSLQQDRTYLYGTFATADNDAYTAIEELQTLFQFDTCNYDGVLNFIKRGGNIEAEIPVDDIVDEKNTLETMTRKDTIEIPRVLNLEYYDIDGALTLGKQSSDRSLDIRTTDEETKETTVMLSADQAKQLVVISHKVLIEEQKGEYEFSLPDSYIGIVVGTVIKINGKRLRVTEVELDDGKQKYTAIVDRASAFTSTASGVPIPVQDPATTNTVGPSVYEFLDIPILSDSDDRLMFYNAVNGYTNWSGTVVDLSLDGGANYIDSDSSVAPSTIGYLATDLLEGSLYYPDTVNKCRVKLIKSELYLEEATLTEMMNRKNLCIIGDELINFGNAVEIEPGLWELDYFLRGRKGTDVVTHLKGERFVLLRIANLAKETAETYLLNRDLTLRATSAGSNITSSIQTQTFYGNSQLERAPAYLTATKSGTDIIITWQGVGRIGSGGNVSQSQHWRGFRVYINGVAQPDQLTEGLTITNTGGTVTIEVCQLNQFTGEGPRASIII